MLPARGYAIFAEVPSVIKKICQRDFDSIIFQSKGVDECCADKRKFVTLQRKPGNRVRPLPWATP